tara:strand:+ start:6514 stop:7209 length:696 start_codon:yes stop_codon:yes gene_type:complete
MSYGDGGFYFLQPVSQPAGAYGNLGAIGKGKKFGSYRVLYQKKPYPKTYAGYKKDVEELRVAVAQLRVARAQARAKIKSLRKTHKYQIGIAAGFMGRNILVGQYQAKLNSIAKAMPLALKRYANAKKRMDAKYGKQVLLGKAQIPPHLRMVLKSLKEKQDSADDYVEQSLIEEEQVGVTDLPEDETMIDEIVVEDDLDGVSMAPSLFEEHKNLIYLGGAGVAAFALYKMMK